MTPSSLRERAASLQAEFEALPIEEDGTTRVPAALRAALTVATTSAVVESKPRGGGFRVSVAFYPNCDAFGSDTDIPVLMLLGGSDDLMPPALCVAAAEALIKRGGPTVEWTVYPGAHHAFANWELRDGGMYKYDANATADAEKRVEAFLATHLRGTR